jgi:hypothetical protein
MTFAGVCCGFGSDRPLNVFDGAGGKILRQGPFLKGRSIERGNRITHTAFAFNRIGRVV